MVFKQLKNHPIIINIGNVFNEIKALPLFEQIEDQIQALPDITYNIKEIRHPWWRKKEVKGGETTAITEYDKDMANPVKSIGVNDYDFYVENGYEYVITSRKTYITYSNDNLRSRNFPSYKRFYENLFLKGKLVKEFNPRALGLPGPTVKIFKL